MSNDYKNEYTNIPRIVIIGDIHGDIKRLKNILINENIINNNLEWIAEPLNSIVIQLGDQIDSKNRSTDILNWEILNDYEVIYFTDQLDKIARAKGGMVISLIGNHELLNTLGEFSYVSDKSKVEFRKEIFKPSGTLANILSKRPIILKINNLLFSHAKVSLEHYNILKKYNKDLTYLNKLWSDYTLKIPLKIEDKEIIDKVLIGPDGILWNRDENNKEETAILFKNLECIYNFVGHTTVPNIRLIDHQIWYCDTGISRAFGTLKYEYINILNKNLEIKNLQ